MLSDTQITHYIKALQEYIPQDIVEACRQAGIQLDPNIYYNTSINQSNSVQLAENYNSFDDKYNNAIKTVISAIQSGKITDATLSSIETLTNINYYWWKSK